MDFRIYTVFINWMKYAFLLVSFANACLLYCVNEYIGLAPLIIVIFLLAYQIGKDVYEKYHLSKGNLKPLGNDIEKYCRINGKTMLIENGKMQMYIYSYIDGKSVPEEKMSVEEKRLSREISLCMKRYFERINIKHYN